jgi:hypothetical protein
MNRVLPILKVLRVLLWGSSSQHPARPTHIILLPPCFKGSLDNSETELALLVKAIFPAADVKRFVKVALARPATYQARYNNAMLIRLLVNRFAVKLKPAI